MMRSVLLPEFIALPVSPGGTVTKTKAKRPLKSKSADDLSAVAENETRSKKGKFKKPSGDKCPDQLKLPFALWTRIAVQ